ncbi:MAG: hypothetical protein IBX50_16020 [Marinospirillum sp.]|uniref:hypothetical protein n=1 Tax=Marinospirillum sp. TaxID=2183934 RepID=UPI001A07D7D4|nr:hypothetical protein [Marinospirillum sp.]MBE0508197.1 hypothetical protein [Marinospirillum sp.]
MYSFLKATFWIGLFLALKKNLRQVSFLLVWGSAFFLVDYFFVGFKSLVSDQGVVLLAFLIKAVLQLVCLLLLFFTFKKLLEQPNSAASCKLLENKQNSPGSDQSLPRWAGRSKKQRIIDQYKKSKESQHEE